MKVNDVGKTVQKSYKSFLSNKPMWMFWIAYTVLFGILFGIFYTTMYLVAQQWWIPIIVIVVTGMIWGTLAYPNEHHEPKEKND